MLSWHILQVGLLAARSGERLELHASAGVRWLNWKGKRVWEVRFERSVVETLLKVWTSSPRQIGHLLGEHNCQREVVAPRRPKMETHLVQ